MFTRLSLFQKHYELIATDLSKQQILKADPKAMQQINFTGNLDRGEGKDDHLMTEHRKNLLSKGLNFAIPPKNVNYADYLLPFQ